MVAVAGSKYFNQALSSTGSVKSRGWCFGSAEANTSPSTSNANAIDHFVRRNQVTGSQRRRCFVAMTVVPATVKTASSRTESSAANR